MRLDLDHVGIVGPDLAEMITSFTRLGFTATKPVALETGDSPPVQFSAHIMFADSYIELTSAPDAPARYHLAPYMDQAAGLHLLLLACADADRAHADAIASGFDVSAVQAAARRLSYADQAQARFRWFAVKQAINDDTLVGWVEHLDAERVFDPCMHQHDNGVTGIAAVVSGRPLPAGIGNDSGDVELVVESAALNTLTGLVLNVPDMDICQRLFENNGVPYSATASGLHVPPDVAAGVSLVFRNQSA